MLLTANWPEKRNIVWQTLTKARAIENQLYVAGVNRTGTDGAGVTYAGESTVIGPKGTVLCDLKNHSDMIDTCAVSLHELSRFRRKFPIAGDEDLFEIYG
jgi:omega-amidase